MNRVIRLSNTRHGTPTIRVFISYTATDLEEHADAVATVVTRFYWIPVDHRTWSASGRPSVVECRRMVESCDVLVVLVAHRYGWVPPTAEGGDGERSITWLEVEHARRHGIPVLPYLIEEDYPWRPTLIDDRVDHDAGAKLEQFKAELKKTIAGFFGDPKLLARDVAIALQRAIEPRLRQLAQAAEQDQDIRVRAAADPGSIIPSSYYLDPSLGLAARLRLPLPKRILAIDSGGVRTTAAFGMLERMEGLLRARYGDPDFCLAQYFDLIGGAGDGALVATLLARGLETADAYRCFVEILQSAFSRRSFFHERYRYLYHNKRLYQRLTESFGSLTLGSESITTGLCILTTRLSDFTIRPFTNHPAADLGDLHYPIRDLLAASMASPTFFRPVDLPPLGPHVDASMSLGQDPSLYLFGLATSPLLPFCWRDGQSRLLLVSAAAVANGSQGISAPSPSLLDWAAGIPSLAMAGIRQQTRLLFSRLSSGASISSEEEEPGWAPLTFRRYEIPQTDELLHWDDLTQLNRMTELGREARAQIRAEDLPSIFDVRAPLQNSQSDSSTSA